jgi:glucose-6-phosphate-specific signal transduction histidine kinase
MLIKKDLHVFRILQELMNNSVRHEVKASKLQFHLTRMKWGDILDTQIMEVFLTLKIKRT